MTSKYLICPIRGELKITEKDSKDKFTEEFRRIELVKLLLNKKYPKECFDFEKTILKYGNQGRNILRADLVVYKSNENLELNNILIVCEVKKSSKDKETAIKHQLQPAFNHLKNCQYAIYFDDQNQNLFVGNTDREHSIIKLPEFGIGFEDKLISYADLKEIESPLPLLESIEQKIHNRGVTNKITRYQEIFKIFILKYFDEYKNKNSPHMQFQIFSEETDSQMENRLQNLYKEAKIYYSTNSPIAIEEKIKIDKKVLKSCVTLFQDYSLSKTSQLVLQDFYMYFAPTFLTKELDQYYTPQQLVDFIAEIIEIHETQTFIDPCGGSGDFLVGLIKKGLEKNLENIKNNAFYLDISQDAVNVASLNMILNGDGRSNIKSLDSIEHDEHLNNSFSICVTNPPFGKKTIWEGDIDKMKKYDIAKIREDTYVARELGVLFVERCVNLLKENGVMAIVLPNGYLTNQTHEYLRNFLINKGRIVGCVSLPEDVFKRSDASGFTDILLFQKTPIAENYKIFVGVAKKIGFEQTRKNSPPIYKRTEDGNYILKDNRKIVDNDLIDIANQFKKFANNEGLSGFEKNDADCQYSYCTKKDILEDEHTRLSARMFYNDYTELVTKIKQQDYTKLVNIGAKVSNIKDIKNICDSKTYLYLDTGELFNGQYRRTNFKKGWELPDRAKISVKKNDILISKTKGCFNKFCIIVEDNPNIIATNGFYRVRISDENQRMNFLKFCFTKNYIMQMESITTGTILADVKDYDLLNKLYIPICKDLTSIKNLVSGFESIVE